MIRFFSTPRKPGWLSILPQSGQVTLAHVVRDRNSRPEVRLLDSFALEGSERDALQRLINDVQAGNVDFQIILVYDVSRWGAMASIAYFDYSINATLLYVVDDYFELSYPDRYPPLARKRVNASAVSMAPDGSRVGYATTIGGISQIQLWNWKTDATATVSTS